MRLQMMALCSFTIFCAALAHAGFLSPTEFPKTIDDMSFVDRMAFKSADYETLEVVYDSNGKCISGCAYAELNLEDELAASERWDNMVRQELIEEYNYTEDEDGSLMPPTIDDDASSVIIFPPVSSGPFNPNQGQNQGQIVIANTNFQNCAQYNTSFTSHTIPRGSPLGYLECISSPYGKPRKLSWYENYRIHRGVDLNTVVGKPVYAPADAVVVSLPRGSCGQGIKLQHGTEYQTLYCHLSQVFVKPGMSVPAGCLIGKTGATGPVTGPHLHYAVKKWDGKEFKFTNPMPFIEPPKHKMCGQR